MKSDWSTDKYIEYRHLPLERAAKSVEIAGVAWLSTGPDASYRAGSVLMVDGGLTIPF